MRDFCKVSPLVWRSDKFNRLKDPDKMIYLYFLTSPHANSCGAYVIPMGYMMVDINWKEEAIKKGIERVAETLLIGFNSAKNVVYVANWFTFNPPSNPNHAHKVWSELKSLPECNEKYSAIIDFAECCAVKGWELKEDPLQTLPEGFRKGIERVSPPDQTRPDQDQTERESKTRPAKAAGTEIHLPDWLPLDDWNAFKQNRGSKFTVNAQNLIIKKLDQFRKAGEDPSDVLQQSIMSDWKGIFPVKGKNNGNGNQNNNGQLTGHAARAKLAKQAREAMEHDQFSTGTIPDNDQPGRSQGLLGID